MFSARNLMFAHAPTGGTWTPADITTLAWYDANDADTITEVSGDVSQWDDKSGNLRHVAQTSGTRKPTYTTGQISFDGTADYLFNSTPFMYGNGTIDVYTVSSVFAASDKRFMSEGNSGDDLPMYTMQTKSGAGDVMSAFIRNDAGSIRLTGATLSASSAFDDTKNLYQWGDTGSQFQGRVNADDLQTAAYTRSGVFTADRFAIGALLRIGSASYIDAVINEIVITSNLGDTDREKVEGYLAHTHGIAGNLPIGHTYKSAAP